MLQTCSAHAPLLQVEARFMDKGVPLVVGCKSGRRSETACGLMTKAGFTGLTNMTGGFDAWVAEGLPVEK
jgi:rhodanese-related sulfurtransferase